MEWNIDSKNRRAGFGISHTFGGPRRLGPPYRREHSAVPERKQKKNLPKSSRGARVRKQSNLLSQSHVGRPAFNSLSTYPRFSNGNTNRRLLRSDTEPVATVGSRWPTNLAKTDPPRRLARLARKQSGGEPRRAARQALLTAVIKVLSQRNALQPVA
jgi:hypothetical protein